ncbi:MAG: DUF2849 domain-containing protein [Rhodobacteraceae bacterium]|nr:DUF2849 domain-containing protein [Paracoccaceae bacterium]
MPKKQLPQIISANDLLSGEVVYLTKTGAWSRDHSNATVFEHADLPTKQLERLNRTDTSIVGTYLTVVELGGDHTPLPAHFREAFRASGPSNRFIGKQAHV